MTRYGIYIHGLAIPMPHAADESWLSFYDPTKHGMRGEVRTTKDPAKALAFASIEDAVMAWGASHGTRPDGRPNRPLTAFTVSIEALPDEAVEDAKAALKQMGGRLGQSWVSRVTTSDSPDVDG